MWTLPQGGGDIKRKNHAEAPGFGSRETETEAGPHFPDGGLGRCGQFFGTAFTSVAIGDARRHPARPDQ